MAVIQDGKAVSDVAQENNVHPNMILNWKKEFLENAAMIFDRHRPDITEKAQRRKIEELETKLKKKNEVIAEIAEESMMIKKLQSNGKLERFHSTLKTEHVRKTPYFSYEDAKEKMAQWIDFYNNGRLHGALLYLTPADYFDGRKESRLAERREKLHTADINRKAYWLQQQHS